MPALVAPPPEGVAGGARRRRRGPKEGPLRLYLADGLAGGGRGYRPAQAMSGLLSQGLLVPKLRV